MTNEFKITKELLKPMVYQKDRDIELLYNDIYRGYHFYILNLGTHPTVYVEIPKNHKYFQKSYIDIENIYVHGGLTYSDDFLMTSYGTIMKNSWFIGWDYGHCDDYCFDLNDGKVWTTEEIIEDCINVINQLNDEEIEVL